MTLVFLGGTLVAPIHAASMVGSGAASAGQVSNATPCPMMGMQADHDMDAEDDGSSGDASAMRGDMSCCPGQALGAGERVVLPFAASMGVTVEPLREARASLAEPVVEPQPPRA